MDLLFKDYKEKVRGCWAGKNIGGVLGAPFEGKREKFDVDFYQQDLTMGPPANDDLDLQIVWLAAAEKYGRQVNASILGEYWLSFVIPNWAEYGMGKANLRAGLIPPLSGEVDNTYKNSCGCFIRSEIWACLAPGHPEIATRYAYEDAIVDHADEGVNGEVFFTAMQSAAFVESDKDTLIDIGLSYIPEDCAVARGVREARECFSENIEFFEARTRVHNTVPGTFGIQSIKLSEICEDEKDLAVGEPGFDAPENVSFSILAWLYGKDDFGKTLCLAVDCGEDTDCTAASLGALMGIIGGFGKIPEKWLEPLHDKIETICFDRTSRAIWVPETVSELTDRVMSVMPNFLGLEFCDILHPDGYLTKCNEGKALYCEDFENDYLPRINNNESRVIPFKQLISSSPFIVKYENIAFRTFIDYEESINFVAGENRKFMVTVQNNRQLSQQQWVKIKLYLPAGVQCVNGCGRELPLNTVFGAEAKTEFELNTDEFIEGRLEMVVDISLLGRHTSYPVKVMMVRKG